MTAPVSILLADSAPLYRRAFCIACEQLPLNYSLTEADCFAQLQGALSDGRSFDLVVVDLDLIGLNSLAQLCSIAKSTTSPVAVTSGGIHQPPVDRMRTAGIRALLNKSLAATVFSGGLARVLAGGRWFPEVESTELRSPIRSSDLLKYLSRSELRVVSCAGQGWKNKQIADRLNLSEFTIKAHLSNVYRKLEIDNRTQLASLAINWSELQ